MPIVSAPHEYVEDDLYVDLGDILGQPLFLKCEGFNFAGSIKLKPAARMVAAMERAGRITPSTVLVESSSGNLGVAVSVIAASKGYRFLCVTDTRCNEATIQMMEALGTTVRVITEPHPTDGFLGARVEFVRQLCASDPHYLWLDQYANPANWQAHYDTTAAAVATRFPDLDVLFVGAGTTGTLMGCARYLRERHPRVRIVAVDAEGSVSFGRPPGKRVIPGLGMGVPPPLLDRSYVDDVVHVSEQQTVRTCRLLAARGFVFGGSTGTVVSGAIRWMAENPVPPDVTAVAIAPDLGERYLDTIYRGGWPHTAFDEPARPAEAAVRGRVEE